MSHFDVRVAVGGIRESMAEGEQHGLFLRVIPLVTNLQSLVVMHFERRTGEYRSGFRAAVANVRLRNGCVREIIDTEWEGHGQLGAGVDVAEKHVGDCVRALT